ncbi:MAG: TonB-dependent receptor [Gemmatimonadetes bacterium]|nr:TonB-dependent receptor [Gemmatimonadota bacterium]
MERALKAIAAAGDIPIAFSADVVPVQEPISIEARDRELGDVLRSVFQGRPLDLWVTASGQVVVVPTGDRTSPSSRATRLLTATRPEQAAGTITGVVTGSGGRPLAGVSVAVAGTTRGSQTDAQGRYTITGVPAGRRTLRATFAGHGEAVQQVTVTDGQTVRVDIELSPQAVQVEGVVAVGYGTARRRDVTGAVGSVSVDEVQVATTATVGQMLQGRVAGAQVTQNDGTPGGGVSIRVRGTASISAASEPLYVIDGVPVISAGNTRDRRVNPLASLSPNDIASIEVLKDASSTAIYGARGASGVVLVTTKQGQRGQDRFTVESSYGTQSPARYLDVLNGPQFADMVNEARTNIGLSPLYTAAEVARIHAAGPGTDWQRELLREGVPMQDHSITFSGGDARTRYLLSGNFFDQQGIIVGSDFRRLSGRVNLDRTLSDRLQVGTSLNIGNTARNNRGGMEALLRFNPVVGPKLEDGTWRMSSPITHPGSNSVAIAHENLDREANFQVTNNSFADFRIVEGLRLRSSLGLVTRNGRVDFYAPRTSPTGASVLGQGRAETAQTTNLTNDNILSAQRELGPGTLDVTGGFSVQTSRTRTTFSSNEQFVNDLTGVNNLGAGTRPSASTGDSEWALLSVLGRANYNLLDRYLFTVTGRRDGSSRFGANNKWGFFPSAAFAWHVVDEPFMANQSLFSDVKLRLSYGVTGNQEIGLYQSLARLTDAGYGIGGQTAVGFAPAGAAPNPDLKWETTRQANAGLDFGVLGNRVNGSIDVYRSVTDDLLLAVALPSSSGFQSQLRNVGSVRNDGVELMLNTINLQTARFSWNSTLTLAHNRNEVTNLGVAKELANASQGGFGGTGQNVLITVVGQPLGTYFGKKTDGLYQQGDACPLKVLRRNLDCVPGEYRYVDVNGDGRINVNDNVVLGDGQPDLYGGLANNVTAGPLELSAFLQFSYGADVLNQLGIWDRQVNTFSNQRAVALDRWTPTNTNTGVPRANADRPREVYDIHVEDGSFVRLQTVSLGYKVPARLVPGANDVRVYVTGQNVKLWTRYSGYDPEVNSFANDATAPGVDWDPYPRARSYSVGVNLAF